MADTHAASELPSFTPASATSAASPPLPPLPPSGQFEEQRPSSSGSGNESSHTQSHRSITEAERARMDKILLSEIGVQTLLTRLKQSISSIRDFSTFLRKRSLLEEDHTAGLKKLARALNEASTKPDNRQHSLAECNKSMATMHEKMGENSFRFAARLHELSEQLGDLAGNLERGRKTLKSENAAAEKSVKDAEIAAEKAATKYHGLAEQYEKARGGEATKGKFGIKKSGAQFEEELLRKVQVADADYVSKVKAAQSARADLINTKRPKTVKALQELILEADSGLSMQMQKFACFTEKLILSNGLIVSPMKPDTTNSTPERSLRDAVYHVDSEQDFKAYVLSQRTVLSPAGAKYEQHPALAPPKPKHPPPIQTRQPSPPPAGSPPASVAPTPVLPHPVGHLQSERTDPSSPIIGHPLTQHATTTSFSGVPEEPQQPIAHAVPSQAPSIPLPQLPSQNPHAHQNAYDLPMVKRIFGLSLEELYNRDQTAVPFIVFKCIQVIDTYGLDTEGLYRLPGKHHVIEKLKQEFEQDQSSIDLMDPETFGHDIHNVTGLLKVYFKQLSDPLLTYDKLDDFVAAAQIEDDNQRRDAIHSLINDLPDANYATLRGFILHLNRVQQHSAKNQMTIQNLALALGHTLLGDQQQITNSAIANRLIETIIANTFIIFEDDP